MWINNALLKNELTELPHLAKVTHVKDGHVNTISHIQAINVPVISSIGIASLPSENDEVLLIPAFDGSYYCIGNSVSELNAGETKITATSGAFIHLMNDGAISINGFIITKEGAIVAN